MERVKFKRRKNKIKSRSSGYYTHDANNQKIKYANKLSISCDHKSSANTHTVNTNSSSVSGTINQEHGAGKCEEDVVLIKSDIRREENSIVPLLRQLSRKEMDEVKISRFWLTSSHIDFALYLIQKNNPKIFCQSCFAYSPEFKFSVAVPIGQFIQIINIRKNHWICLSNIFSPDNNSIMVYDSAYLNYSSREQTQIFKLTKKKDFTNLIFPKVQSQTSGSGNCGPLAIGFAIALSFGVQPETIAFDELKLRTEIWDMFDTGLVKKTYNKLNYQPQH